MGLAALIPVEIFNLGTYCGRNFSYVLRSPIWSHSMKINETSLFLFCAGKSSFQNCYWKKCKKNLEFSDLILIHLPSRNFRTVRNLRLRHSPVRKFWTIRKWRHGRKFWQLTWIRLLFCSIPFLPATPLCQSQTLERLLLSWDGTQGPSTLRCALLLELERYIIRYGARSQAELGRYFWIFWQILFIYYLLD